MRQFDLSKRNKFILFLSIILFLILAFVFFGNNSMHKSVHVGDSDIESTTSFVTNTNDLTTQGSSPSKSKPIFVSKTDEEKMKETSIMMLLMILLGFGIYAISSKDNYK